MTWEPATDSTRCEYHAETTDQQCGRNGWTHFGGLWLCHQHQEKLEHAVLGEIHRNTDYERRVRRELRQIEDWRDDDLRKPELDADATVYFLKRFQFVKIGYAEDVCKRIRDINRGSAIIPGMVCVPVKLLATIPGGYAKEQALHQRFRHLRVAGEWFVRTAELERFINGIERST